jgi:hypothetical protein
MSLVAHDSSPGGASCPPNISKSRDAALKADESLGPRLHGHRRRVERGDRLPWLRRGTTERGCSRSQSRSQFFQLFRCSSTVPTSSTLAGANVSTRSVVLAGGPGMRT